MRQRCERPWPVPDGPWVMTQRWHDLLFMHWPLAPQVLRPLVPAALPLDTYDGRAWIGIVPFWMSNVRPRLVPPIPGLSRFPELNVRTYVSLDGKPGVYFFSLDAANRLAVAAARLIRLPYFHARMSSERRGESIEYASHRIERGAPRASFRARYRPTGDALRDIGHGTLPSWLTARYCLYTVGPDGRPYRLEIDHRPWP
ncbi:MAG: YqjF family protein, partial [Vicinamibacterales bacterium]